MATSYASLNVYCGLKCMLITLLKFDFISVKASEDKPSRYFLCEIT